MGTDATIPYTEPGHHPVFSRFRRWEGWVEENWSANWLGVRNRADYYVINERRERRYIRMPPLAFDEEYFEWIDLLESVVGARGQYTMIELGAGYGRWIANAAAAVNQYSRLPFLLIAVEAEPQHFAWLQQHLEDNRIDLRSVRLLQAAVAATDGRAVFEIGNAYESYGQAIVKTDASADAPGDADTVAGEWNVDAVSLESLLRDVDHVDLIDADIQGAEADIFEAAPDGLDAKVKRVHVETHGPEVERRLRIFFGELGWRKLYDFPSASDTETPYGVIHFEGGVQTWLNPQLNDAATST